MRIAIVHYHLQPSGVTRVIEHIIEALSCYDVSLVVLTGQLPTNNLSCNYRVIPGLQYELIRPRISSAELAGAMENAAIDALGALPDIWHIHNHCLGKNLALPGALLDLANRGNHLLMHIHDFAEDGRPGNYKMMLNQMAHNRKSEMSRLLYPKAHHVHYVVLNNRDLAFLRDAGADPDCLHRLPNAVKLKENNFTSAYRDKQEQQLWLYPTRAIRRKNLGEFLLWSAVAPDGHLFGTTLGPVNPQERPRYEAWIRLAEELKLPVKFELSTRSSYSFEEMLVNAQSLVTTSMAEGFGQAFLEPWLFNRPVYGRDLPEITKDFRENGIVLQSLYERLDVPVEWLGLQRIVDNATITQTQCLQSYGRPPVKGDLDRLLGAWIKKSCIDFGCLNEEMQEDVLRKIVRNPGYGLELSPAYLATPGEYTAGNDINRNILKEKYSLSRYGKQLWYIYNHLATSKEEPLSFFNGEILLDYFLSPKRLTLLRMD